MYIGTPRLRFTYKITVKITYIYLTLMLPQSTQFNCISNNRIIRLIEAKNRFLFLYQKFHWYEYPGLLQNGKRPIQLSGPDCSISIMRKTASKRY